MSMNFDTYSTSFQSLMQPMYNVNANYSGYGYGAGAAGVGAGAAGAGAGIGAGAGVGGYGMGYGMGFMSPMMNVGIGQFNADYLIKNDDKNNNYYTRPVAVHKKKDETGTMLGILGAALGTVALLAALRKGKAPRGGRTVNPTPINPPVNPINPVNPVNPVSPVNQITNPSRLLGPAGSSTTTTVAGGIDYTRLAGRQLQPTGQAGVKPGTQFPYTPSTPVNPNPVNGNVIPPSRQLPAGTVSAQTTVVNGNNLLPAGNVSPLQRAAEDVEFVELTALPQPRMSARRQIATNLPSSGEVIVTPYNAQIKGYLPAGRHAAAVARQQAAMNLPSSGQVYAMGSGSTGYTRAVVPSTSNMVEEKLFQVRPDLANNGHIVATTHTPETISNGYSIGANAKGADKLAALRAKLQG